MEVKSVVLRLETDTGHVLTWQSGTEVTREVRVFTPDGKFWKKYNLRAEHVAWSDPDKVLEFMTGLVVRGDLLDHV